MVLPRRVCALIRAARLFFDHLMTGCAARVMGSFSPTGQLHPGPTALAPLPRLEIRDVNVAIEVFGPAEPTCWLGYQPGVTRIPSYVVSTHGTGTAIIIPTSQMRGLWPASSGLVASSDDNHARIEQP